MDRIWENVAGLFFNMAYTDYCKVYEDAFGITWDRRKYEIHHIDGDHSNNDISNLILLPRALHRDIHTALNLHNGSWGKSLHEVVKDFMGDTLNGWSNWDLAYSVSRIMDAVFACTEWCILKKMDYHSCDGEKIKRIK